MPFNPFRKATELLDSATGRGPESRKQRGDIELPNESGRVDPKLKSRKSAEDANLKALQELVRKGRK